MGVLREGGEGDKNYIHMIKKEQFESLEGFKVYFLENNNVLYCGATVFLIDVNFKLIWVLFPSTHGFSIIFDLQIIVIVR